MAFIILDRKKLKSNFNFLNKIFKKHSIEWSIVTKLLCGYKEYLSEVLSLGIKQVCDSRISNLRIIKAINPNLETVYIKPPAKRSVANVVKYADISMNTEIDTIKMISSEAVKQKKFHKIIIMIELGELREGVMRDNLVRFYEQVFSLPNIEIIGIGANLSCLYGVLPNQDKLIQLSLYKQLIEVKFDKKITYVSGGSSVTIPLVLKKVIPKGINHFRVGETLFLGTDVYNNTVLKGMNYDVFTFFTEIIELIEKPVVPNGEFGTNVEGHSFDFDEGMIGKKSYRAIIDVGLLDVDVSHLTPVDSNIKFAGASSDMIVVDIGENEKSYKVGDLLEFKMDYMGILRILNSKYVEKKIK